MSLTYLTIEQIKELFSEKYFKIVIENLLSDIDNSNIKITDNKIPYKELKEYLYRRLLNEYTNVRISS